MTEISKETVGLLLARANRHLQQAVANLSASYDITPQQLWVMLMLLEGAVLTASDITTRMPIDKAAASRLIERLVELGWVVPRASKADRRRQLLVLTAKGKRMAMRLGGDSQQLNARMLRGLSPEALEALSRALRQVIANLG